MPSWDVFIKSFPSRYIDLGTRVDRKIVESQRNSVFLTQNPGLTHIWSHRDYSTHSTCIGSNQTRPQHWEGKTDIKSHPQTRSYFQLILTGEEIISFLQWSVIEYINYTPEQAPTPDDQCKMTSLFVRWFLLLSCACFCIVFALFFCVFYF